MKKRVAALILGLFFILNALPCAALDINPATDRDFDVPCQAAILIDEDSGTVLYEKNADESRPIASITKIMTLLLTFEALEAGKVSLSDIVPVSEHAYHMGGSQIWLEPGEQVDIKNTREDFYIEPLEGNFDGLNFLADQNMSVVNRKAMEGTILAHNDGGVPIGVIEVDSLDAYNVGYLIYFFWKACAVSGYLLSVNPFDQPGVESYKKNMFALLGKPGYEDRKAELEAKLG